MEEFGLGRDDNSHNPIDPVTIRDDYYRGIFEHVYQRTKEDGDMSGVNFWAYGGEGRPRENGGWWDHGDDFIGDPPHERQGWYSVYDKDFSTLRLIKEYATKFDDIE